MVGSSFDQANILGRRLHGTLDRNASHDTVMGGI